MSPFGPPFNFVHATRHRGPHAAEHFRAGVTAQRSVCWGTRTVSSLGRPAATLADLAFRRAPEATAIEDRVCAQLPCSE